MAVTQEYLEIPVDGRSMRSFLVGPRAGGPYPGIVFYSDIFQLTAPTLRWAVRLAGHGFVVVVPEIYHRVEPAGTVLGFDDEGKRRGQADAERTPVADFDADIRAAVDYLSGRPGVGRIGAAGHCTGGHLAFRAALLGEVEATACWYATGLHDGKLGQDADAGTLARAPEIDGELLMIFGTRDPHTPAAARTTIHRTLNEAELRLTWHEYDAEHAFGRDAGDRYDPEITDRAFTETIALFHRVLTN